MTRKRNIARKGAIGGLIAGLACAALPMSASAQTATNDQIKQLQDAIRQIQKQYQSQIRGLQKQLDDLKAAQAAPKVAPPPPSPPGSGGAAAGRRTPAARAGRTGSAAA
jgi:TolA-binding protein